MNFKILSIASFFFMTISCSQKQSPVDLTTVVQPFGVIPSSPNGYGGGLDQLAQPDDVEILSNGSFVITDVDNNRIQLFSSDGSLLKSVSAKHIGLKNKNIVPTGVATDGNGFIYVSLEGVGRIARFTPELIFDQFIGYPCNVSSENYYNTKNDGCLINPQGIVVAKNGDIFVIDMAKNVFKKGEIRNFGFRKFYQETETTYLYDQSFAKSQEITTIMRKSEGMAIGPDQKTLYIAEEKPQKNQFGNSNKMRYVAAFDLKTGHFLNKLFGVSVKNDSIVEGVFKNSVEGISVLGKHLFAVDEKGGKVVVFDLLSGSHVGSIGRSASYYCDDESDCLIDGVNYNEQNIMAGRAIPHLKNDWRKSEMASPDGISTITLDGGSMQLAVVDQWNSRILLYDLSEILKNLN
jgi:hypothetical protein